MNGQTGCCNRYGVAMKSTVTWFLLLTAICIAGPYLLGIRPRTRRQWLYLAVTVAFLAWILPLMTSLRSA